MIELFGCTYILFHFIAASILFGGLIGYLIGLRHGVIAQWRSDEKE